MIEKCILDQDPQIEIEPEDFSEEADSTILVREKGPRDEIGRRFQKSQRPNRGRVDAHNYYPPKDRKTNCVFKARRGSK